METLRQQLLRVGRGASRLELETVLASSGKLEEAVKEELQNALENYSMLKDMDKYKNRCAGTWDTLPSVDVPSRTVGEIEILTKLMDVLSGDR